MKKKNPTRIALIFICAAIGIRIIYYALTEGFSLERIRTTLVLSDELSLPPPSARKLSQLKSCTDQLFYYLKKGSQAYAFISEDGQYILKLFKYHHMQPAAPWFQAIPLPNSIREYRDSLVARREHRISLTLNSYKIAALSLRSECALAFAQIIPSKSYSLPVTIRDGIGREYAIDLADHGFALQRKADLIRSSFEKWIAKNDMDSAKAAIDSLVGIIAHRSRKEIQDSDPDLFKNAGLVGTTAIFIDIGGFHKNPKMTSQDEMKWDMDKVFRRFAVWLSENSEELHTYLQQRLESPWESSWSKLPDYARSTSPLSQ